MGDRDKSVNSNDAQQMLNLIKMTRCYPEEFQGGINFIRRFGQVIKELEVAES